MKINIVVLVLGNYLELGKYVDYVDTSFEKFVVKNSNHNGDLFNIHIVNAPEYDVEVSGEDIEFTETNKELKIKDKKDYEMLLSIVMLNNRLRYCNKQDIFGIYTNSTLTLKSPEVDERVDTYIYYNYLVKDEEIPVEPDLLYIIDNGDTDLNSRDFINFLVNKYKCDTTIVTLQDTERLKESLDLIDFPEDSEIEIKSFDF